MAFLTSTMKKKHMIIYAVLVISGFPFVMYKLMSLERESENNIAILLETIKKQKIDYVQFEFGTFPFGRSNIVCKVSDKDKLSVFEILLSKVDSKHKSGHISPTLEFSIDIGFVENKKKQYLGWIYNKHPNDIYLETSLWKATDSGSYKRKASGYIRVPGAAAWVNERQQECLNNRDL